jgi:redox-sensitive bicupin YhaK (pirin superfamily)
VEREVEPVAMSEGAGAKVRRLFPTRRQQHIDPFVQLWINLPHTLKDVEPDYQPVPSDEIPEEEEGGVRMRTVVGEGSPVELRTEVRYVDVTMESGATFRDEISADWNGLLYVLEGEVELGDATVGEGKAAIFEGGGEVCATAKEPSRFVLIAGARHREPIRQRGSFVA